MMTIIDKTYAKLEYDEQTPCFVVSWFGFQKLESVVEFCEEVVAAFAEKRKTNPNLAHFIGDTRNLEVLSSEIREYWDNVWNPKMFETGGRFIGIIVPTNVFSQFVMEQYSENLADEITEIQTCFFDDLENAKTWLKTRKV